MTDGGKRVRPRSVGLRGIFTSLSVDLVQLFCLGVIGLQVVIANWPSRRDAPVVLECTEILPAQAKQRSAVELGIAADVVVRVRMQRFPILVVPVLFGLVLAFEVDEPWIPVRLFTRHK